MARSINRILIANRGEIALRVIRTARSAGYGTVAVFSDPDRSAPHVAAADLRFALGGASAAESYLDIDRLLEAAAETGSDAVHPGYGFLSENAEFARRCEAAGLVFIGPPADAIELMGNKAAAKQRMHEADVPCVPGYEGDDQSDEALARAAAEIGFPVMVKAAAGGGGRGMRIVGKEDDLPKALATARSEAANAFGSDQLILERAIVEPRHVEIQVFGDRHGNVIHLGERDCSVQRRHQKIIEEAPCPVLTEELREARGAAAVEAARSIGYVGAGTVEFLLDRSGDFYFLEMNTRLQVEHPVTEMVTGLDLVAMQLRVAEGAALDIEQADVTFRGHAIEARLYAEDPAHGFLPSTGPIELWQPPEGPGIRVDGGVESGFEVSPYYDPMLAKVVAWGADRREALRRLRGALAETVVFGPVTNRDFLLDAISRQQFIDGEATTAFLEQEYLAGLERGRISDEQLALGGVVTFLSERERARASAIFVPPDLLNWSSNARQYSSYRFRSGEDQVDVRVVPLGPASMRVEIGDRSFPVEARDRSESSATLVLDGRPVRVRYLVFAGTTWMDCDGRTAALPRLQPLAGEETAVSDGQVKAPMHGVIQALHVSPGDEVVAGQPLLVLEAMKMQHEIRSEAEGRIAALHCQAGDQVSAGSVILEIQADEESRPKLEQAEDFRDESDALHGVLEELEDEAFETGTRFKGWTFNDVLRHLHVWNQAAMLALTDEAALMGFLGQVVNELSSGDLRPFERRWCKDLAGTALREAWHDFYHELAEAYGTADPATRVKWAGPDMSVRSAITARLMETWAHGQAIYDALGLVREDDDRIRNIAVLGIKTFGWTFKNRGKAVPESVPHVRLTAPSGETWEWNEDNPSDRIEGSATEFCQVVAQTRNVADTELEVRGEIASQWMAIAQCFAGPPVDPPEPGTRYREEKE
ncbi:MAG: TIGR03084 family metal-binding protein [Xanthomonadales bacterium]|nr:TIGR03084 family metal-binding protein [Xanthomonadales bacterium]